MKRNIAIILAVLIVIVALMPQTRQWVGTYLASIPTTTEHPSPSTPDDTGLDLPDLKPVTFNNIFATPVGIDSWKTFLAYRTAAEKHDLPALSALSYQLSNECKAALADPTKTAPCYQLMDSLVFFTEGFEEKDFTQVAYDEKQVVLSTAYIGTSSTTDPIKTVIYFVRGTSTQKVLGLRFCVGTEAPGNECVRTSPDTRDTDKDGWWDDVEALFKK